MKTKPNIPGAISKFIKKSSNQQSFGKNDSTDSEVHSKLRRSTRRATIERRVWFPPQKEKFYQKKCPNQGRTKGSKSAYVKWKESQKRKIGGRHSFLSKYKGKGRGSKDSTLNGEIIPNLSNGGYLLDNLSGEGLLVENEAISLQSVVTDEVITDTYIDTSQQEANISDLDSGKKLSESAIENIRTTISSEDLHDQNISETTKQQQFLDAELVNLHKQTLAVEKAILPDIRSNIGNEAEEELLGECSDDSAVDSDMHVSLDEALAELVDSEHGMDCETVTIHPVFNENEIKTHPEALLPPEEDESKALNLVVNKADIRSSDISQYNEKCKTESLDMTSCENSSLEDSKIDSNSQNDLENSYSLKEESSSMEKMNKTANISRLDSKPLSIKTPLKCSECSMRFCTVRSLLWHFGTHLKLRSKQKVPIILEDLVAAWDTPEKPITVAHEKTYNYKEDYKWTWPPEAFGNDDWYKSPSYGNDHPEDLSVDKHLDDNFVGANGEFILKVPAIPKPKLGHSPLRDILTSGNGKNNTRSLPSHVFVRHLFPGEAVKSRCNSADAQRADVISPHSVRVANNPKLTNSPLPSNNNSPLRNILTSGNERNNGRVGYLKSRKSYRFKSISPHMQKSAVNSSNGVKQSPPISVPTSTHPTPTISTCSTPLDSCPTEANIRLLSQVSNTLNKLDISRVQEHSVDSPTADIFSTKDSIKENYNFDEESTDDATLVRINDNLALRIVSTATTVGELTISVNDSSKSCQKSNQFTNTVSIFPQTKVSSEIYPPVATPDILTIVPQTESSRNVDNNDQSPAAHIITATGRLTPDASRIVKLVLMPHEEADSGRDCDSSSDSGEESDCGMVIDVREEDGSMDPLSLCSVSLDDDSTKGVAATSDDSRATEEVHRKGGKTKNRRFIARVDDENYKKRKYVCQYCQKRFGWSTDLKRHIILHTGERPFKCKWCPINCTRKFLLQNHMRKVHPQLCKWSDLWD